MTPKTKSCVLDTNTKNLLELHPFQGIAIMDAHASLKLLQEG